MRLDNTPRDSVIFKHQSKLVGLHRVLAVRRKLRM